MKLTQSGGIPIYVDHESITAINIEPHPFSGEDSTIVYLGPTYFRVSETQEEVLDILKRYSWKP